MQESLKKAQENYRQKCKIFNLRVNRETEADIVEWLSRGDAAPRIKALIREDIKKSPAE
jgi:oligoribonuclease NrnB/cAMP/cGMP phosphodiesterase (DHH superfamily)